MVEVHNLTARVWEWEGKGAWHFITIEKPQADLIKKDWHWPRKGFGSIPVNVQVGKTKWQTSIFPEKGGSHLLPLKKLIRDEENIKVGDTITLHIQVID